MLLRPLVHIPRLWPTTGLAGSLQVGRGCRKEPLPGSVWQDIWKRDSQAGQLSDLPVLSDGIPHPDAPRVACGNELVPDEK